MTCALQRARWRALRQRDRPDAPPLVMAGPRAGHPAAATRKSGRPRLAPPHRVPPRCRRGSRGAVAPFPPVMAGLSTRPSSPSRDGRWMAGSAAGHDKGGEAPSAPNLRDERERYMILPPSLRPPALLPPSPVKPDAASPPDGRPRPRAGGSCRVRRAADDAAGRRPRARCRARRCRRHGSPARGRGRHRKERPPPTETNPEPPDPRTARAKPSFGRKRNEPEGAQPPPAAEIARTNPGAATGTKRTRPPAPSLRPAAMTAHSNPSPARDETNSPSNPAPEFARSNSKNPGESMPL